MARQRRNTRPGFRGAHGASEISAGKDGRPKLRLYDKIAALQLLGRHLAMFKEHVEIGGAFTNNIEADSVRDIILGRINLIATRNAANENSQRDVSGATDSGFVGLEDVGEADQLALLGDWLVWLILAGRGWGKTRVGSETIRSWMCGRRRSDPELHDDLHWLPRQPQTHATCLSRARAESSRHPPDFRPHYEPSKRRLTWPNGAIATVYNARLA